MMKIVLTGSTGFVGKAILRKLLRHGHRVMTLIRRESHAKLEPFLKEFGENQIIPVYTDLREEKLNLDLRGYEAILHLVAIMREIPEQGITYSSLNFHSARKLIDLAQVQGIRKFLLMSSIQPPPYILRGYYQNKEKAETYLKASPLEWTIFKPSFIYGKKLSGKDIAWIQVLKPFFSGISFLSSFLNDGFSSWTKELEPISLEEIARAFLNVLQEEQQGRKKEEKYRFSILSGTSLFSAGKLVQ